MAQSHYAGETPASERRDKQIDQFAKVTDQVESAAASVVKHGRDVGNNVQEVAGNLRQAVDTSVKEQPMATLAIAGAIGFVLGALWKT